MSTSGPNEGPEGFDNAFIEGLKPVLARILLGVAAAVAVGTGIAVAVPELFSMLSIVAPYILVLMLSSAVVGYLLSFVISKDPPEWK